jgi:hypothetical protein
MIKKIFCAVIVVLGLSQAGKAQFRPTVSLLSNYTVTTGNDATKAGAFDIKDRKINLGFEVSNKFYLGGNYFIKTGLRYNSYKTTVGGKNQQSVFLEQPYPLYWERRYESISMPALFGKEFMTANGKRGDYFFGVSAGVLSLSYAKDGVSSTVASNANSSIGQSSLIEDNNSQALVTLFPTLDLGASCAPFGFMPRFSMGILCSVQLNKADPYTYHGVVRNETTGTEYHYDLQRELNYINCAITFNYTFGRERPFAPKKLNKLSCPR